MAGLLDIFGTGGADTLGLLGMSQADIQSARDDAQAQALYGLAGRLFQGGNTGASIAQGLQQGQQLYKQAMQGQLQEKLTMAQLQEMQRKKKEEALAKALFMQGYQPQVAGTAATPVEEDGRYIGETPAIAAKPASFDITKVAPELMALGEAGQQRLKSGIELQKMLRSVQPNQAENPFAIFVQDPTIPANIRNIANQYASSYSKGLIEPEKADQRVKELGDMAQRASQFQQTQAGLDQQRQQANALSRMGLDLRQAAEANKPEQFSYSQKKDFDVIQGVKDEARKAEANAYIAKKASSLVDTAYAGSVEAGLKGALGAVGYETEAKTANDALKRISNQLAVNAPRFSGPTSDADAKRYDQAVGDLANPKVSATAKKQALKDINELATKASSYASQAENYFFNNNKSLRGFKPQTNPYDGM